jgi:hypothetical protein
MSRLSKLAPLKKALVGISENDSKPGSRDSSVKDANSKAKAAPKSHGISSTALLGKYSTLKAESKRNNVQRSNTALSNQLLKQRMFQRTEREQDMLNFSRHRLDVSRNGALNPSQRKYYSTQ